MRDREYVTVVYTINQDGLYSFKTETDFEVVTRATGGQLAAALSREIGLSQKHALYVRVPDDISLSRLGLDSLPAIALIPIEADLGDIVRRKR